MSKVTALIICTFISVAATADKNLGLSGEVPISQAQCLEAQHNKASLDLKTCAGHRLQFTLDENILFEFRAIQEALEVSADKKVVFGNQLVSGREFSQFTALFTKEHLQLNEDCRVEASPISIHPKAVGIEKVIMVKNATYGFYSTYINNEGEFVIRMASMAQNLGQVELICDSIHSGSTLTDLQTAGADIFILK